VHSLPYHLALPCPPLPFSLLPRSPPFQSLQQISISLPEFHSVHRLQEEIGQVAVALRFLGQINRPVKEEDLGKTVLKLTGIQLTPKVRHGAKGGEGRRGSLAACSPHLTHLLPLHLRPSSLAHLTPPSRSRPSASSPSARQVLTVILAAFGNGHGSLDVPAFIETLKRRGNYKARRGQ
jgi:hypothetical protein